MKKNNENKSVVPRFPPGTILYKLARFFPPIEAIPQPSISSNLENFPWYERVSESLRYSTLKLEYWLSPRGYLRWWMQINLLMFMLVSIPSILFTPLIVYVIGSVTSISSMILTIVVNVLKAIVAMAVLTALIALLHGVIKKN